MFSRTLIATDLTTASKQANECLQGLRSLGCRHVILTYVLNTPNIGTLEENIRSLVAPELEAQRTVLEQQGFATEVVTAVGIPSVEINRIAQERDCSAILVASSVSSLYGDILFGGLPSAVIQSAVQPVLILRLHQSDKDEVRCCVWPCQSANNILFPTDFSDNAERAFAYVASMVEAGIKSVTLLHVQDKSHIAKYLENRLDEFNTTDKARLERLRDDLLARGAENVKIELPYGSPTGEILARARQADTSLVVMGSQGRGFISEIFLGSVSHSIARSSSVPVLLIPALRP